MLSRTWGFFSAETATETVEPFFVCVGQAGNLGDDEDMCED